ncbi:MAG: hypothetical protein ACAH95_07950 [Fimbriimonas sp.]
MTGLMYFRARLAKPLALAAISILVTGLAHSQIGAGGLKFRGYMGVWESLASTAPVLKVDGGSTYAVAIRADGSVVGWGATAFGGAIPPQGLKNLRDISAGGSHTLGITSNQELIGWGTNNYGESVPPAGIGPVKAVSAGFGYSLAIRADGTLAQWGWNIGLPPAELQSVKFVSAGSSHALAVDQNGKIYAWGDNSQGQCNVPVGLPPAIEVGAAEFRSYALLADGTVIVFGSYNASNFLGWTGIKHLAVGFGGNVNGQLYGGEVVLGLRGDGSVVTNTPLLHTTELAGITQVSVGGPQALALKSDGTLYTFENGASDSSGGYPCEPPVGAHDAIALSGTGSTLYLKRADATLGSFGLESRGGHPPKDLRSVVRVTGPRDSGTFMPTGSGMAIRSNGSVTSWGNNQHGVADPPLGLKAIDGAVTQNLAAAVRQDGTVAVWGYLASLNQPPAGLNNVVAVSAHSGVFLALKNDGTVVHWGGRQFGIETIPAGLSNVVQVVVGLRVAYALRSNGTVVEWGEYAGEMPSGLANVVRLAIGTDQKAALLSNGTVVTWGGYADDPRRHTGDLTGIVDVAVTRHSTIGLSRAWMFVKDWRTYGGDVSTGTVYLGAPAPAGGVAVALSSDPGVLVPASVLVPAGAQRASFSIRADKVTVETKVRISSSLGSATSTALVTVVPAARALQELSLDLDDFTGGSTQVITGTVRLNKPAPIGGLTIPLTSSDPSVVMPPSVTIAEGQRTATFTLQHSRVTLDRLVNITAKAKVTLAKTLTIRKLKIGACGMSKYFTVPNEIVKFRVRLSAIMPESVTVDVEALANASIGTSTVTVPAFAAYKDISVTTAPVVGWQSASIKASFDDTLTIVDFSVVSLFREATFSPGFPYGMQNTLCSLSLVDYAPAGGLTVNTSSSTPNFIVPPTVFFPAGTKNVKFWCSVADVVTKETATFTAEAATSKLTFDLVLNPNIVSSVSVSPSTFIGGSTTVVKATIKIKAAAAQDVVVNLTSTNSCIQVPATAIIPAGQSSVIVTLQHTAVQSPTSVVIKATRLGKTASSATITVNP